jgi:YidC/Oxa1 family membrane protein insertase
MRALQPELKRIKRAAKGDRQKESAMLMELYKERGINPFGTFPTLIIQFIVLIGLYSGLQRIIHDPHNLVNFAYPALQDFGWMQELAKNIHRFDNTLFGVVDLGRSALSAKGGVYWPAMLIVVGSALAQYFQSKQLLPVDKDQRSLRAILKDAGKGKQADQSEVTGAVGRTTLYFLPFMIFVFTVNLASALSLYWLVGGIVAYIQQSIILGKDEEELEALADGDKTPRKNLKTIPEAEIVAESSVKNKPKTKKSAANKRRKKR